MNLIDTNTKHDEAKSLPWLIHSAKQFIKRPYNIVHTFIVNKYMGLQSIYYM